MKAISIRKKKNNHDHGVFKFEREIAINVITAIKQKIDARISEFISITADFSTLEKIDITGIQLIVHLKDVCRSQHIQLDIIEPQEKNIAEECATLGIHNIFKL